MPLGYTQIEEQLKAAAEAEAAEAQPDHSDPGDENDQEAGENDDS